MVTFLIALLAAAVICIVLLTVALARSEGERRALLDRLLVANQIMPIAEPPTPAVKRAAAPVQRIKFKVFP